MVTWFMPEAELLFEITETESDEIIEINQS
jgi:hypothetical protein